jgi:hypothetical protein
MVPLGLIQKSLPNLLPSMKESNVQECVTPPTSPRIRLTLQTPSEQGGKTHEPSRQGVHD